MQFILLAKLFYFHGCNICTFQIDDDLENPNADDPDNAGEIEGSETEGETVQDTSISTPNENDKENKATNPSHTKAAGKLCTDIPVKQLANLAGQAGRALDKLANRPVAKAAAQPNADKTGDKDWCLAMLIYNKLKDIPDGDDKDDLHLDLQRVINQTKKKMVQRQTPMQTFTYSSRPPPPTGCVQQPLTGAGQSWYSDGFLQMLSEDPTSVANPSVNTSMSYAFQGDSHYSTQQY